MVTLATTEIDVENNAGFDGILETLGGGVN